MISRWVDCPGTSDSTVSREAGVITTRTTFESVAIQRSRGRDQSSIRPWQESFAEALEEQVPTSIARPRGTFYCSVIRKGETL